MFEHVYTIWDFFDRPRDGLADFAGAPHYYKCRWDEGADDYSSEYDLTPVSAEFVQLAMEQWAIWRRWESAFQAGTVSHDTHPGFGGVDQQYDELESKIDSAIAALGPVKLRATAEFRAAISADPLTPKIKRGLEVQWSTVA